MLQDISTLSGVIEFKTLYDEHFLCEYEGNDTWKIYKFNDNAFRLEQVIEYKKDATAQELYDELINLSYFDE